MKPKELQEFRMLYRVFEENCHRVAKILGDREFEKDTHDITYANEFHLEGDDICWSGDEYWNYGGHEYHSGYFPAEYLVMDDDELREIVEKENREYREAVEKRKEERKKQEKSERLELYEKLKKEFEK